MISREGSALDEWKVRQEVLTFLGLISYNPMEVKVDDWKWETETVRNFFMINSSHLILGNFAETAETA